MYMGNQTLQTWQSDCREPCRAYLSPLLLWSKEKLCSWACFAMFAEYAAKNPL